MSAEVQRLCRVLANGLVAGRWDALSMRERADAELGCGGERWPQALMYRILREFPFGPPPKQSLLEGFLAVDSGVRRAIKTHGYKRRAMVLPVPVSPRFDAVREWGLPQIRSSGQLAAFCGLTVPRLRWLADVDGLEWRAESSRLRNYRYKRVCKRTGGTRLLESPKPRLKEVQRLVLDEILYRIPSHDAAHGFCPGRSIETFVEGHVGQQVVMRIDLRQFFPSIDAKRVQAIFRSVGYPFSVSRVLAGLCTNTTWQGVLNDPFEKDGSKNLAVPHLPQGAPASPALANLCAYRLDCRLSGLAKKFGGFYTRYADDLVFSGDRYFSNRLSRVRVLTYAVCLDEGFSIQQRKTRVMPASTRQSVAGVVVNSRLGVDRREFDALKAILFNCVRFGLESQNRAGHPHFYQHLRGRIAWVNQIHPQRGEKLMALFRQIEPGVSQ